MTFHLTEFIFYFLTIIFLLYEFSCLNEPTIILSLLQELKGKKPNELTGEESGLLTIGLLYPVWGIIGLFTSQCFLFLGLFLLSIIGTFIKKYHKAFFLSWFKIDTVISIILLILIVLNKFYFKVV